MLLCTSCSTEKEKMQQLERQHSNQVFPFVNTEKESITSSFSDKNVNAGTSPPNTMPANFSYANPLSNRTDKTPPLPPVSPCRSQASSPLVQDNNHLQRLSQPDVKSPVRWAVFSINTSSVGCCLRTAPSAAVYDWACSPASSLTCRV